MILNKVLDKLLIFQQQMSSAFWPFCRLCTPSENFKAHSLPNPTLRSFGVTLRRNLLEKKKRGGGVLPLPLCQRSSHGSSRWKYVCVAHREKFTLLPPMKKFLLSLCVTLERTRNAYLPVNLPTHLSVHEYLKWTHEPVLNCWAEIQTCDHPTARQSGFLTCWAARRTALNCNQQQGEISLAWTFP